MRLLAGADRRCVHALAEAAACAGATQAKTKATPATSRPKRFPRIDVLIKILPDEGRE
jgi:hypothetical protein